MDNRNHGRSWSRLGSRERSRGTRAAAGSRRRRLRTLVSVGVLGGWIAVSGCHESPTMPPASPDVTLDVVVGSSSGSPEIRALVRNGLDTAIWHWTGCGYWGPGLAVHLVDASGQELLLWDPRTMPRCADGRTVLQSGDDLEATAALDGTLFTPTGESIAMEPGSYTAVVEFGWGLDRDAMQDWAREETHLTFQWPVVIREWP
jgi:hypothetical protein